ncbi:hypothetical protein MTYM_00744 [Methylococcales bacterium]|nr:hypothetical protein MTYM_00744 [Methylococcales bacterium]
MLTNTFVKRLAVLLLAVVFLMVNGCGEKKPNNENHAYQKTEQVTSNTAQQDLLKGLDPKSVGDQMSKNIKNFLVNNFLKDELQFLTEADRKFQFYPVDLNGDGKDEYFVRLNGPYFCGTGGCTMLILDRYAEIITKFSVMDGAVNITGEKEKSWLNLYVFNNGAFRVLKYDGKTYPANPSVAPKVNFVKKSTTITFFNDTKAPAYTYSY